MVSTRSKGDTSQPQTGDKRSAPTKTQRGSSKKAKKEKDGKLDIGDDGTLALKQEDEFKPGEENGKADKDDGGHDDKDGDGEDTGGDKGEAGAKADTKAATPVGSDDDPRHGTLESGHIYFLYRPKVEVDDPESIDDISKFHILLLPKSPPYSKRHYHRIIEVGKKKLPDQGAKHQVIWGLVSGVGEDKATLKDAFGAYEYDTKTRGHRHQPAARPAGRGHYILHSPRDALADSPSHDRKRDYKTLLAYELTLPAAQDFGRVQDDLGLAHKGAIVLQVKDPGAESRGNPRAAGIPREKRANYPEHLQSLFENRRFIPANPPSLLSYGGTELLLISSPHELHESLGGVAGGGGEDQAQVGKQVEGELDSAAEDESVGVNEAMRELGLNAHEFEEEALEGAWT